MSKVDKVYLTGFMTSGKSTIGPILANVLGWKYFDLDDEIVKKENKTVDEIFSEFGESYFRKLEKNMLVELSNGSEIILSLGGGTIIDEDNLAFIKKNGYLVYLKSSPDVIYNRIKHKLDRPLFKDLVLENRPRQDFIDRIHDILTKREKYYNAADLSVKTNSHNIGGTIDYIANKIAKLIDEKN